MDRKFHFSQININQIIRAASVPAALILLFSINPEPQLIEVTFLGDVMMGRGVYQASTRVKNWQPFSELKPILRETDLLAANLESPLTIAPVVTTGYALCAPPGQVEALRDAAFGLVTLANNHTLDCGETGRSQTALTLRSVGIRAVEPAPYVEYVSVRSQKLAFLALDDISNPVDMAAATAAIRSAKEKVDFVIISIHWGNEYQTSPSSRQRNLAAGLARAGADVIIGHHPHVIQPAELIRPGEGQKNVPVFYSLGNAIFDQHGLADTRIGEAVTLVLGPSGSLLYRVRQFELDPNRGTIRKLLP